MFRISFDLRQFWFCCDDKIINRWNADDVAAAVSMVIIVQPRGDGDKAANNACQITVADASVVDHSTGEQKIIDDSSHWCV